MLVRRAAHAEVNFLCAGFAEALHAGHRGGAAHDAVVHDHDAFPAHHLLDEVELHAHIEIADELRGLEKGAADVVIADEGLLVADAKLLGETECGVVAAVGHGDDNIGLHGRLNGELASHFRADARDIYARDDRIGPRKIDILEHAECAAGVVERTLAADALFPYDDDLAGIDVADEFRADEVEGARLAREHVAAVLQSSERQRAEAVRIAHADDFRLGHHHERERALDAAERGEDVAIGRLREEVEDDLAVHRRLKNGALRFEFGAEQVRVHEVAIVPDGDLAARAVHHERLRIRDRAAAGGRVAHMADGTRALQPHEIAPLEDLRHEAHVHMPRKLRAGFPGGDDARALLTAVLEGEETVVGQLRRVWVTEHGEDAALVFRFVVVHARQAAEIRGIADAVKRRTKFWKKRITRRRAGARSLCAARCSVRESATLSSHVRRGGR